MTKNNTLPWGVHLVLDVSGCDKELIKNHEYIKEFCKALVDSIKMEAYGEPQVVHFGNDYLEGNTLVQLISTSNIMAHFNDVDGSCYFDLFSCKPFDKNQVVEIFDEWFYPTTIRVRLFPRQANTTMIPNWLMDLWWKLAAALHK